VTTSNVDQRENAMAEESGGNRHRTDDERVDAVFEVLADARRRRVVRILRTHDGDTTSVPALAEALASREPGDPDPDRLVVSLRHVHLPKLDATGVVEYTAERSQVRYTGAPLIEHLLDQL
jgi:hypothetical protein